MDVELTAHLGQRPPQLPPADRFQANAMRKLMEMGERVAEAQNAAQINAAHLLASLGRVGDADATALLEKHGLGPERIEAELRRSQSAEDALQVFVGKIGLSEGGTAALSQAVEVAEEYGQQQANYWHILLGLLLSGELSILLTRLHEGREGARLEVKEHLDKRKKK